MKYSRRSKSLSSKELESKLNEGGWIVSGGHQARELGFSPKLPVVKASLLGETLKIETGDRSFEVPSDNIVFFNPWAVEIRNTFMRRQQCKKIDGGGWHEVPTVGIALRVSNPTLEETIRKDCEAQAKRKKEDQEGREAEALANRRQQFSANINAKFAGMKLIKIEVVDEWKLQFLFEDNSTIEIASEVCDCYFAGGSAVVNGIALKGFQRPEYVS